MPINSLENNGRVQRNQVGVHLVYATCLIALYSLLFPHSPIDYLAVVFKREREKELVAHWRSRQVGTRRKSGSGEEGGQRQPVSIGGAEAV